MLKQYQPQRGKKVLHLRTSFWFGHRWNCPQVENRVNIMGLFKLRKQRTVILALHFQNQCWHGYVSFMSHINYQSVSFALPLWRKAPSSLQLLFQRNPAGVQWSLEKAISCLEQRKEDEGDEVQPQKARKISKCNVVLWRAGLVHMGHFF